MIFDVAVLGGGPAGMAAATEAARGGVRVVLLEESPTPGGQVYRAPPRGFEMKPDRDRKEGDALRAALAASGAEIRTGCRVWGLGGGPLVPEGEPAAPFSLSALGADGAPFTVQARALILCCGTHERIIPFPGWTLPGVIGRGDHPAEGAGRIAWPARGGRGCGAIALCGGSEATGRWRVRRCGD
jgi:thioredoxin reductase